MRQNVSALLSANLLQIENDSRRSHQGPEFESGQLALIGAPFLGKQRLLWLRHGVDSTIPGVFRILVCLCEAGSFAQSAQGTPTFQTFFNVFVGLRPPALYLTGSDG